MECGTAPCVRQCNACEVGFVGHRNDPNGRKYVSRGHIRMLLHAGVLIDGFHNLYDCIALGISLFALTTQSPGQPSKYFPHWIRRQVGH